MEQAQHGARETARSLNQHFGKHRDSNTHEKEHGPQPGIRPSHGKRKAGPTLLAAGAALAAGYLLGRNWPAVAVLLGASVAVPATKGATHVAGAAVKGSKEALEAAGKATAKGAGIASEAAAKGAEVATSAATAAGVGLSGAAAVAAKAVSSGAELVSETGSRAVHMIERKRRPSRKARVLLWAGKSGLKMAGRKTARKARKTWSAWT